MTNCEKYKQLDSYKTNFIINLGSLKPHFVNTN